MWNEKKPRFLVDFNPSSCSEALKIPYKFTKHIVGSTSGTVFLLGPSGHTWHANLVQQNDDLLLQDGWAAFVSDHSLDKGDSLVFRYDGNLHFTVQIFDQSSCEKEAAFSSECSQGSSNCDNHVIRKRDRENLALLDSIIEAIPKRIRSSQVLSESLAKSHEMERDLANKPSCLRGDVGCLSERTRGPSFLSEKENGFSTLTNSVTIAVPSQEDASQNSETTFGNSPGKEKLLLSAPEADRLARTFTSSYPNFTKIMKKFNISGSYTLNIPYQFAMAHLPKSKVKIVLRNLKGESWTVNSIPTTRVKTSHTFCGGWLGFVRDNNINIGDVCIFELVHKCELRVHIIHVIEDGMEDQSKKEVCKSIVNGSCDTPNKISRRKSKKMSGNSHNSSLHWMTKADKKGYEHDKMKVLWEASSQGRLGSHTRGCVSLKSAPEEKLAAQSFISSFPHFVRIMKKFNVSGSYTLKIPFQFSTEYLPNCRTEVVLRNSKGKCWTVNSIPTTKVQTLHTFCGGWMAFVRDNDIQMGDICIFELVGKHEMRVHISGTGKKLDYQSGRASSNEGCFSGRF